MRDEALRARICEDMKLWINGQKGWRAAGVFESIEQAVKTCVRTRKVFTPDAERHAFYMQQYDKYLRIYEALRSL